MRGSELAREFLLFLFFLLLAVLNTWPLVLNLGSALSDPGDPYLNAWILQWDWWATFHRPGSLFHAPIFHPARYALAFSENMYGISLLFFPLYAAGAGPITVYNVAVLSGLALCGYGAFVLARMITGSTAASIAAGIFYAFVPYRMIQLPHLQHIWGGWLPLILAALVYHWRRPSWRRAALFGVTFLMNGLTNIHWLLFGSVALTLSGIYLVATQRSARTTRFLLPLVTATAVALVLLLPFLLPYRAMSQLYGAQRGIGETTGGSARAYDWFISAQPNHLYGRLPNTVLGSNERTLFPGLFSLILAASALLLTRTEDFSPAPGSGREGEGARGRRARGEGLLDLAMVTAGVLAYFQWALSKRAPIELLIVALALLLLRIGFRLFQFWKSREAPRVAALVALRPHPERWRFPVSVQLAILWIVAGFLGSRGIRRPFYEILFDHVYGFRAIRVPARFAMIAYVGLAVLVAVGLLPLLRGRSARVRAAVGAVAALLFLVELRAAPFLWFLALPQPPPVYPWLARAPISGVVLELPMGNWEEAEYVLRATAHHRPLINGVSGYIPLTHQQVTQMAMAEPMDRRLMDVLEQFRCSLVIVHNENMNTRPSVLSWLQDEVTRGRLIMVGRFEHGAGGDYVFALSRTEPRAVQTLRLPDRPDASGQTPLQKVHSFLAGNPHSYNAATFGWMDTPIHEAHVRGKLGVFGWALSPHGVERVDLRFENGRVIIPAERFPFKALEEKYPWYPKTQMPGFMKNFVERPPGISEETDLQVEILDGAGNRIRLEQVMFRWLAN